MGSDEAPRAARPILLLGLSLWLAGLGADTQGASPGVGMNRAHGACEAVARREEDTPAPSLLLQGIHPDFGRYIRALRPLGTIDRRESEPRPIYMALVRPGAVAPVRNESAPFIGPGARNDILYDVFAIGKGRSTAWTLLLLDHEYFHARHLAGSTSLPLPSGAVPEIERHFYEAAAWGFNVAQARSGRYAGLRPDEFRE